ncbi:MAG: peptide chain release factor N(5)-glutamine methyltransferase [Dysgonamonadaceae bacterium]|jgi:release factor glutamine methyltransferase|nr:peptide chain release factor N(5)-glutamine methyltransferase [Dysgonamonadaceae bacterium]
MKKAFQFIQEHLQALYPETEIRSLSYLILEFVCKKSRQSLLFDKDNELSSGELDMIIKITEELKKYRPIQYIIGETEFYGLKLLVNENVLIPRPETEELVEAVSIHPSVNEKFNCLDIGTGSGCIAVALAKRFPFASIYALDISEKALDVACKNAARNDVNVNFICCDIMEDLPDYLPEQWDVIISNPPYITPEEKDAMSENVLNYEPCIALFVPQEKPLLFYERIADIGLKHLKPDGTLYFETNSLYGNQTAEMLVKKNYSFVELRKDISGKDRIIKAQL